MVTSEQYKKLHSGNESPWSMVQQDCVVNF